MCVCVEIPLFDSGLLLRSLYVNGLHLKYRETSHILPSPRLFTYYFILNNLFHVSCLYYLHNKVILFRQTRDVKSSLPRLCPGHLYVASNVVQLWKELCKTARIIWYSKLYLCNLRCVSFSAFVSL